MAIDLSVFNRIVEITSNQNIDADCRITLQKNRNDEIVDVAANKTTAFSRLMDRMFRPAEARQQNKAMRTQLVDLLKSLFNVQDASNLPKTVRDAFVDGEVICERPLTRRRLSAIMDATAIALGFVQKGAHVQQAQAKGGIELLQKRVAMKEALDAYFQSRVSDHAVLPNDYKGMSFGQALASYSAPVGDEEIDEADDPEDEHIYDTDPYEDDADVIARVKEDAENDKKSVDKMSQAELAERSSRNKLIELCNKEVLLDAEKSEKRGLIESFRKKYTDEKLIRDVIAAINNKDVKVSAAFTEQELIDYYVNVYQTQVGFYSDMKTKVKSDVEVETRMNQKLLKNLETLLKNKEEAKRIVNNLDVVHEYFHRMFKDPFNNNIVLSDIVSALEAATLVLKNPDGYEEKEVQKALNMLKHLKPLNIVSCKYYDSKDETELKAIIKDIIVDQKSLVDMINSFGSYNDIADDYKTQMKDVESNIETYMNNKISLASGREKQKLKETKAIMLQFVHIISPFGREIDEIAKGEIETIKSLEIACLLGDESLAKGCIDSFKSNGMVSTKTTIADLGLGSKGVELGYQSEESDAEV